MDVGQIFEQRETLSSSLSISLSLNLSSILYLCLVLHSIRALKLTQVSLIHFLLPHLKKFHQSFMLPQLKNHIQKKTPHHRSLIFKKIDHKN